MTGMGTSASQAAVNGVYKSFDGHQKKKSVGGGSKFAGKKKMSNPKAECLTYDVK
jgi:hypothetical protein